VTFDWFQRLRRRAADVLKSYGTEAGRRALWNLTGSSVCAIFAQACGACGLLLLTGWLGQEGYGALGFALTLQWYLMLAGSVGSGSLVIRDGAERPAEIDAITTSYFALTGLSSTAVCAATLIGAALAPVTGDERWLLALVAVGTIPASASPAPLFALQHRQARAAFIGLIGEAAQLVAVFVLTRSGPPRLAAVGLIFAAKWASVALGQLVVYHLTVRRLRWSYSTAHLRQLFRSSWPMMLVALVFFVPLNAGVLMVRTLSGDAAAGVYTIAYQVANAYYAFASLAVQIVQPHISGVHGLEASFVRKLTLFAAGFFGGLALLAGAGGVVLIQGLLAPAYRPATVPMAFLLLGALMMLAGNIAHIYLLRFNAQRLLLAIHVTAALAYWAGGALLVARVGLLGPAVWTAVVTAVATGACLAGVRAFWPRPAAAGDPAGVDALVGTGRRP
jgi:O-antigen/teichoic acid export membrane protein